MMGQLSIMFNTDTELLFPTRVIPSPRNIRGDEWKLLIDRLTTLDAHDTDVVAFTALITRMASCNACNADSFRAMRGCTQCARLVIRRYKGSDNDLLELFRNIREDVEEFMRKTY